MNKEIWWQSYEQRKYYGKVINRRIYDKKYINKVIYGKVKSVSQNTSIPVHLYIGVLKYISLTVYQLHQQASVYQSTCIPVIKKKYTSPPVYQSLSH